LIEQRLRCGGIARIRSQTLRRSLTKRSSCCCGAMGSDMRVLDIRWHSRFPAKNKIALDLW
jgi:hypothetical protein